LENRMSEWKFLNKEWEYVLLEGDICDCDDNVIPFEAFWKLCSTPPKAPHSKNIPLTISYSAVVKADSDRVKVGCQDIPISAIREVVKVYDELHK